jgi:hypothetical protein
MVTDSFPPFATEMTPGLTDSNQAKTPSFFTTASAPSMKVEWPPLTLVPCTWPFLFPNPIVTFLRTIAACTLSNPTAGHAYRASR